MMLAAMSDRNVAMNSAKILYFPPVQSILQDPNLHDQDIRNGVASPGTIFHCIADKSYLLQRL
jgi:hypothetical protein